MDLLFKRAQTRTSLGRPRFDLHAKLDFKNKEETDLLAKYKLDKTLLVYTEQPGLLRNSMLVGVLLFIIFLPLISFYLWRTIGLGWIGVTSLSALIAVVLAYIYYHQKRETIYVKDLLHGRYFHCFSICELVRKESYLRNISAYLRQVMESSKHWDGDERFEILPLTPEEAKAAIHSGPLM